MSRKLALILMLGLVALLVLASCQRSASQSPQTALITPTVTGMGILPQSTGMNQVQMIGTTQMIQTLTAVYQQTQGTPGAPLVTTQPTSTSNPFGTTTIPNTFTLVPPTGVATTPAAGITPYGTTSFVTPIFTPVPIISRPASYTLAAGEFPYCIARRFNVNQTELLNMNNLASAELYQPGMVLQIPQSGNPFVGERALHPHPGTYTVSSADDTIGRVACYYGDIDPGQIINANSLTSPYTLHINQTLTIP